MQSANTTKTMQTHYRKLQHLRKNLQTWFNKFQSSLRDCDDDYVGDFPDNNNNIGQRNVNNKLQNIYIKKEQKEDVC
jgi:hypothetical protein